MKPFAVSLIALGCMLAGSIAPKAAGVDTLSSQNPFAIVGQLTAFSYEELAHMYPALSEVELRSLRWRIVNHMQGLE